MKRKRRRPPETVFRAIIFPVYLLLTCDTRYELPIPMLSHRNGRWGCHVECTEAEAFAAMRDFQALRRQDRQSYASVVGSAIVTVESLEALRRLADAMTPTPEGFFYGTRISLARGIWEAVFVPWEKMHVARRAMG